MYLTWSGSAKRIYPNGLQGPDTRNNVERIVVEDSREGDIYTVHIEAKDLLGAQDYSLVITGCFSDFETPSVLPTCRDLDGEVVVDDLEGAKSCSWLAQKLNKYGYLCKLTDVASQCQQSCGFCNNLLVPSSYNGEALLD